MKFSEMTQDSWAELQLYLDTCLIPYTALNGNQSPVDATESLERLRDFLDLVEIPFKGRTMTYPAFHYDNSEMSMTLNSLSTQLKSSGFKYVVIISSEGSFIGKGIPSADLVLSEIDLMNEIGKDAMARYIGDKIRQMWQK